MPSYIKQLKRQKMIESEITQRAVDFFEYLKENLKVSVSTDFNECNGDTVTVKLLLKNKEGEFETIDKSTAYLT